MEKKIIVYKLKGFEELSKLKTGDRVIIEQFSNCECVDCENSGDCDIKESVLEEHVFYEEHPVEESKKNVLLDETACFWHVDENLEDYLLENIKNNNYYVASMLVSSRGLELDQENKRREILIGEEMEFIDFSCLADELDDYPNGEERCELVEEITDFLVEYIRINLSKLSMSELRKLSEINLEDILNG